MHASVSCTLGLMICWLKNGTAHLGTLRIRDAAAPVAKEEGADAKGADEEGAKLDAAMAEAGGGGIIMGVTVGNKGNVVCACVLRSPSPSPSAVDERAAYCGGW